MPFAYDTQHAADRNRLQMLQILRNVDSRHCQCPYGAAGKEVGYPCPGTSVDWAYDKLKVPYSFAFEIWGGSGESLRRRWEEKVRSGGVAFLQGATVHNLSGSLFRDLFEEFPSDFVGIQLDASVGAGAGRLSGGACFDMFNP